MASSIERELKTLLTYPQYQKLFDYFQLDTKTPIVQSNHYYDTLDEDFKAINAALRLRIFNDQSSEWTIKHRLNNYESIELTQTNEENNSGHPEEITTLIIHSKDIQDFINKHGISWSQIRPTMSLTTTRYNIETDYGLYALDATQFNHAKDFELELEAENIEQGLKEFNALLNQFDIHYLQADTKLARAHYYSLNE